MDHAGLASMLLVMGLVAAAMLVSYVRRRREWNAKIRLLAEHLHGEALGKGAIRFKLRDYRAMFELGDVAKVTVWIPSYRGGRLMIVPERLGGQFHRLFGMHDIEIGDPRFDRAFIIQARPEAVAHRVFDPAQRAAAMEAVRRPAAHHPFMIRAENGRLEIWYHEAEPGASALLDLVRAASDLIPLLLATPHTGMEFGETAEQMDGRCPICTTELSEPLVRCTRCAAPHHRECWDYVGRCAVYACEPARRPR
ncbi:MAG: hypothetical protein JO332_00170 [Planctomycetaceae bacterium]|nr:hypothetical protein [Planctomycetaceae bacterium]